MLLSTSPVRSTNTSTGPPHHGSICLNDAKSITRPVGKDNKPVDTDGQSSPSVHFIYPNTAWIESRFDLAAGEPWFALAKLP